MPRPKGAVRKAEPRFGGPKTTDERTAVCAVERYTGDEIEMKADEGWR